MEGTWEIRFDNSSQSSYRMLFQKDGTFTQMFHDTLGVVHKGTWKPYNNTFQITYDSVINGISAILEKTLTGYKGCLYNDGYLIFWILPVSQKVSRSGKRY